MKGLVSCFRKRLFRFLRKRDKIKKICYFLERGEGRWETGDGRNGDVNQEMGDGRLENEEGRLRKNGDGRH